LAKLAQNLGSGKSAAMKQALIVLIWALATTAMADDTIRYYDEHGRYAGKAVIHGKEKRYYDKNGRYIGKDTQSDRTVRHYDNQGRLEGRYECPKDRPCF